MGYTATTLGALVAELSNRLYDPSNQFWSSAELQQRIADALMYWNLLTAGNQQWYALTVANSGNAPWYDLQTLNGTPRTCSYKDTDVYSRLQYHLLEAQLADAGVLTAQFTAAMLVSAVQAKRDEFLFLTSCTRSVEKLNVSPNVETVALPGSVIQVERGYWLPASGGNPYPLYRSDQFARAAFYPLTGSTPGDPAVMSSGIEPPLTVALTPPPDAPGQIELVTIESQAALSATSPTTLLLPSDFMPALAWGAMADLLGSAGEAADAQRAQYARSRFLQYAEAMTAFPFIMGARVNGLDAMVASVEALDTWNPAWRTPAAVQNIVAFAGQNLVCYPTTGNAAITLLVNGSASLPANTSSPVQVGQEALDYILDLAQHEASFKMGGAEFAATMPLFQNFLRGAAKRNDKIAALATFKDWIYGNLNTAERLLAPAEVADE